MAAGSRRLANLLLGLGLDRGDRVATPLGRSPQVHLAAMGVLRAGGVFAPLLSLLGPAPLLIGSTLLIDEAEIDPARWLRILQQHAVNVLYTSPAALGVLMRLDANVYLAAPRRQPAAADRYARARRWARISSPTPAADSDRSSPRVCSIPPPSSPVATQARSCAGCCARALGQRDEDPALYRETD